MNKCILNLIFFFLSVPLFSQQFEGGFFGGVSASQVDGDTYAGYNKLGITAGAYTTRKINTKFNFKMEVRYIQKGAYKKPTDVDLSLFKTSLHYAEIPFLFQYLYNKKVFLEGGLVPEILLASKEENEYGIKIPDPGRPFHRFVLEGTVGTGYFFTDHWAAGFRYTYSILPIRDHSDVLTYWLNKGQNNNVLSFSLYYHIR